MQRFNKLFLFCLGLVFLFSNTFPKDYRAYAQDISTPGDQPPSLAEVDYQTFVPLIVKNEAPPVEPELQIISISFPSDNKILHHTTDWPGFVFRRVQWLSVQINYSGDFQSATDSVTWRVLEPTQEIYNPIPQFVSELPETSWAVQDAGVVDQTHTFKLFIPADAALGLHHFEISLNRNTGSGIVLQDRKTSPEFYVIFNPFNDDSDPRKDTDVYNYYFSPTELNHYSLSGIDINYYGQDYIDFEWVWGREVVWLLNMFDPIIFLPVMAEVQGVRSAKEAVRLLTGKDRWDHRVSDIVRKDSDIIDGEWNSSTPGFTFNWLSAPAIMSFWNWGEAHPMGQCMDFGGLLAAMVKAIGVPVRTVTCVLCHSGVDYDFHVWNEVWLNEVNPGAWSAVDGMADVGPVRRDDLYFQDQLTGGLAVYTYDARTGSRIDVKNQY